MNEVFSGDLKERGLRLETIERALEERLDYRAPVAAALACQDTRVNADYIRKWERASDGQRLLAAVYALGDKATFELLEKNVFNWWGYGAPYALMACRNHEIPTEWIERTLDSEHDPRWVAPKVCAYQKVSRGTIRRWLQSGNPYRRAAAMYAATNAHVPAGWLRDGLDDPCTEVTDAAVLACHKHQLPGRLLEKWWHNGDEYLRMEIMRVCELQQQELGDYKALVYEGLSNSSEKVALGAARACRGKYDIPDDVITCWLSSPSISKVVAAMYASMWRDNSINSIPRMYVNDANVHVRRAAREACFRSGPKVVRSVPTPVKSACSSSLACAPSVKPLDGDTLELVADSPRPLRDFEPGDTVFRPCLGALVAAKIPGAVDVRSEPGKLCRAYTAEIVDVCGDFYGEKVGISNLDLKTQFRVGDLFVGADFDIGGMNDRGGFWFVRSPEDAEEVWDR